MHLVSCSTPEGPCLDSCSVSCVNPVMSQMSTAPSKDSMRGSIPLDVDPAATMTDNHILAASRGRLQVSCWLTLVWVCAASKNMSIMGEEHVRDDKVLANTACRYMFSCSFNANLKGNWHVRTSQSQARQVQLNNVLQCQCLGCEQPSFVHTHGKSLT